jgi:DUF1365 family protein
MGVSSQILTAKVMHKRLHPKINAFVYRIFYICIPDKGESTLPIALNKPGIMSFYYKDHGHKDGSNPFDWAKEILVKHGLKTACNDIRLIAMPRILGYVFNPVSFWLCHNKEGEMIAVICEVNNTFGETHSYICAHKNHDEIKRNDVIEGQKLFHVSPFLKREGTYKFRFDVKNDKLGIFIDFYDEKKKKTLVTSLIGNLSDFNKKNINKAFYTHPLVTLKAIYLIHYQALKLIIKGIKYIKKPKQLEEKTSTATNVTKI